MESGSKLFLYAMGYVAKDKVKDNWYVDIHPIEQITTNVGDLTDKDIIEVTTIDVHGNTISVNVDKSKVITAKWLPLDNSNRITPPDIMKGETVNIYNFNGIDGYYWNTVYCEPDLRKHEKVIYFYSNKDDIENKDYMDKGYYLTVNTYDKYIKLHTADNDGEHTTYDIDIDTKEGKLTIRDGKGNFIELDSADDKLHSNINRLTSFVTPKFEVINSTTELVKTLSDLVEACITEQHIGNLGIPTKLTSGSVSKFKDIKKRIDSFIQ